MDKYNNAHELLVDGCDLIPQVGMTTTAIVQPS